MESELLKISPFPIHLGIEIMEKGEGFARLRLPYRKELTNPVGKLHGGAIASVADTAMAMAIGSFVKIPGGHSTVKLEIKYKAPVMDGEIVVEGRVTRHKGKLFLAEAEVTNGNGQVVAFATGTFMITHPDVKPG
jgi:acyl-CoA thioesterase